MNGNSASSANGDGSSVRANAGVGTIEDSEANKQLGQSQEVGSGSGSSDPSSTDTFTDARNSPATSIQPPPIEDGETHSAGATTSDIGESTAKTAAANSDTADTGPHTASVANDLPPKNTTKSSPTSSNLSGELSSEESSIAGPPTDYSPTQLQTAVPEHSPRQSDYEPSLESSSDEYFQSDEEDVATPLRDGHERLGGYATTLTEHTAYLCSTLSNALDSLQLDKSLVIQAQLSGKLNNDNQMLIDKRKEVYEKLQSLQSLYNNFFHSKAEGSSLSKVEQLQKDIQNIERRIEKLKYGTYGTASGKGSQNNSGGVAAGGAGGGSGGIFSLFKTQKSGVVQKYPIEYNQARDKVVERQID